MIRPLGDVWLSMLHVLHTPTTTTISWKKMFRLIKHIFKNIKEKRYKESSENKEKLSLLITISHLISHLSVGDGLTSNWSSSPPPLASSSPPPSPSFIKAASASRAGLTPLREGKKRIGRLTKATVSYNIRTKYVYIIMVRYYIKEDCFYNEKNFFIVHFATYFFNKE
jgi:hypothetical protein